MNRILLVWLVGLLLPLVVPVFAASADTSRAPSATELSDLNTASRIGSLLVTSQRREREHIAQLGLDELGRDLKQLRRALNRLQRADALAAASDAELRAVEHALGRLQDRRAAIGSKIARPECARQREFLRAGMNKLEGIEGVIHQLLSQPAVDRANQLPDLSDRLRIMRSGFRVSGERDLTPQSTLRGASPSSLNDSTP